MYLAFSSNSWSSQWFCKLCSRSSPHLSTECCKSRLPAFWTILRLASFDDHEKQQTYIFANEHLRLGVLRRICLLSPIYGQLDRENTATNAERDNDCHHISSSLFWCSVKMWFEGRAPHHLLDGGHLFVLWSDNLQPRLSSGYLAKLNTLWLP